VYLQGVSEEITELQRRPAHHWQSAEESSLDAWFEGYPYYRSPERSISYYNKGEILGILLDLRVRQITQGNKSLRDVLQWMNEHYAKQHRFFPDSQGVEEAAEAVTRKSFAEFFRDYVSGVQEIPYDGFFQLAGLHVVNKTVPVGSAGFTTTANLGGQPEVVQVDPNGNADRAGIAAGDRVITIDGKPADASLDDQLSQMPPGTTVHLRIENRRGQREVKLRLGLREQQTYELQDLPSVTPEQRAHRVAWIHGDDESRGTP
jgi:predicted metalloprotease with PDZ domain